MRDNLRNESWNDRLGILNNEEFFGDLFLTRVGEKEASLVVSSRDISISYVAVSLCCSLGAFAFFYFVSVEDKFCGICGGVMFSVGTILSIMNARQMRRIARRSMRFDYNLDTVHLVSDVGDLSLKLDMLSAEVVKRSVTAEPARSWEVLLASKSGECIVLGACKSMTVGLRFVRRLRLSTEQMLPAEAQEEGSYLALMPKIEALSLSFANAKCHVRRLKSGRIEIASRHAWMEQWVVSGILMSAVCVAAVLATGVFLLVVIVIFVWLLIKHLRVKPVYEVVFENCIDKSAQVLELDGQKIDCANVSVVIGVTTRPELSGESFEVRSLWVVDVNGEIKSPPLYCRGGRNSSFRGMLYWRMARASVLELGLRYFEP